MSEKVKSILSTLQSNGIQKTWDEVVADFRASDNLAGFVTGLEGDALEQAIESNLTSYIIEQTSFVKSAPNTADPTKAEDSNVAMPEVGEADMHAIRNMVKRDMEIKEFRSQNAVMNAVLIDRPYPGDWMTGIGKLATRQSAEDLVKKIESQRTDAQDAIAFIASKLSQTATFIPNNAQLRQLEQAWTQAHTKADTGKLDTAEPGWFGTDNDALVSDVLGVLQGQDKTFAPLIAPKEDVTLPNGKDKLKAWRWRTKGFQVTYPATLEGAQAMTTEAFTTKGFRTFMLTQTAGYIKGAQGQLYAKIFKAKQNNKHSASAVKKGSVGVRVGNNSPKFNPQTIVINNIVDGATGSMTVRSEKYYLAVQIRQDGKWTVKKERLSLTWPTAPVFEIKPEYSQMFGKVVKGGQGDPTPQDRQNFERAMELMYQEALTSSAAAQAYGIEAQKDELQQISAQYRANSANDFN